MKGELSYFPPDLLGDCRDHGVTDGRLLVAWSDKETVDPIIRANHYSGTTVWSSFAHFVVFDRDSERVIGALQYGPPMNPAASSRIADGLLPNQLAELNRMWLDDAKPPNTASRAIAFSVRLLRRQRPFLRAIQSFADSRCGKLGAVYQAASFVFLGHHDTTFYELDGEWFHKSALGRKDVDKRGWRCGPRISRFNRDAHRATQHTFRQYRYLRCLDTRLIKQLKLPILPYPKPAEMEKCA